VDVQAYSSVLAEFAGLSQTNDNFFQVKVGVPASRTPAQARTDLAAIRHISGTPTGGSDGDVAIGKTKPEVGAVWLNTAGTWAIADNSYAWASRPAAASYEGRVILITDWDHYFKSDGTNWVPMGKLLLFGSNTATTNHTGATTESATVATDTFPAGLVLAGWWREDAPREAGGNVGRCQRLIRECGVRAAQPDRRCAHTYDDQDHRRLGERYRLHGWQYVPADTNGQLRQLDGADLHVPARGRH
jgi:hypothetical protein